MFTGWARLRPHNAWRDGGLRDLVAYRQLAVGSRNRPALEIG